MTATPIASLTVEQLDVVLAGNVRDRAALQDRLAHLLDDIERRTRRIDVLLGQWAQLTS